MLYTRLYKIGLLGYFYATLYRKTKHKNLKMTASVKNIVKFDTFTKMTVFVVIVVAMVGMTALLQGADAVPSCCDAEVPHCCISCCRDALVAAINAAKNPSASVSIP